MISILSKVESLASLVATSRVGPATPGEIVGMLTTRILSGTTPLRVHDDRESEIVATKGVPILPTTRYTSWALSDGVLPGAVALPTPKPLQPSAAVNAIAPASLSAADHDFSIAIAQNGFGIAEVLWHSRQ